MAQNENVYKEAVAVFVWFAAALLLLFVAAVLIFRPWASGGQAAYAGAPNYEPAAHEIYIAQAAVPEPGTESPMRRVDLELINEPPTDDTYETEEPPPELSSPFAAFPFFIPENEETYAKFHAERPELDAETVVWMVNVHLHLPFFYKISINEDPVPLLVNSFYRLPEGFLPHSLVSATHDTCSFRVTPETAAAFRKLRASALEAGFGISISSAFRPAHRQQGIFHARGGGDGRTMRPYHSEHQTGRALDLNGPGGRLLDRSGPTAAGTWVAENAHLYGFIIRYRAETTHITGIVHEPWHITYVGTEISMYMHNNGILSLEEFVGRNPGARLGGG